MRCAYTPINKSAETINCVVRGQTSDYTQMGFRVYDAVCLLVVVGAPMAVLAPFCPRLGAPPEVPQGVPPGALQRVPQGAPPLVPIYGVRYESKGPLGLLGASPQPLKRLQVLLGPFFRVLLPGRHGQGHRNRAIHLSIGARLCLQQNRGKQQHACMHACVRAVYTPLLNSETAKMREAIGAQAETAEKHA